MSLAALRRAALAENVSIDDDAVRTRSTHPYREDPDAARSANGGEEAVVYGLLVVIGLIPVLIALANEARFGGEPTIGTMMVGAGLWGLGGLGVRRRRS